MDKKLDIIDYELLDKTYKLIKYFDLFDYPLIIEELESLICKDVKKYILHLEEKGLIETYENFCYVKGKRWTIENIRKEKVYFEKNKKKILNSAFILSNFPFVRAVILTGSVANGILNKYDDFDFLVIVAKNRLWICRTIITLFRRFISLNYRKTNFKNFCVNYYLSEENLEIQDKNEFIALQIFLSQPLINLSLYNKFISENNWINNYYKLDNKKLLFEPKKRNLSIIQVFFEFVINLFWNKRLEKKLLNLHYNYWIKRNKISNIEEFNFRASMDVIKNDFGLRQKFMLKELQNFKDDKYRNKFRTKVNLNISSVTKKDMIFDILLTHAYFLSKTKFEKKIMKPYVPLGPLYVASYLKTKGYKVGFYDTTFAKNEVDFSVYIHKNRPAIVGIYVLETTRKNALKMIEICKSAGIPVIVGGPDPSNEPQFYIDNGADIVVIGEGEITLSEVLELIKTGEKQIYDIEGIYSAKGYVKPRKFIEDIDNLPFPSRELVDFEPYFKIWKKYHGITSMHILASRGCPYNCSWCCKPVFKNFYRQRRAENVVEEMLYIKKTYNPDQLWFVDDIFGIKEEFISEFHKEVLKKKVKIPFECLMRVDLINIDKLKLLKEAGCYRIWYGAESGSQKVLDKMNKKFMVEQIKNAAIITKSVGIEVGFFIMLGYPGETISDIELTRNLLKETKPDYCGTAIAYPLKGTKFYDEVKNILLPSAKKYRLENNNKIVFKTLYPQIFYNICRRLLNKQSYIQKNNRSFLDVIKYEIYKITYEIFKYVLS